MTTLFHCESENCCAVCRLHQCGLTAKQMRGRACLNKQCWHLEKIDEHPYWQQRKQVKLARDRRKERIKKALESTGMKRIDLREMLPDRMIDI